MKETEKKEDLRVRRTKKLLSNALFDLIKKKPFDKITVCDICDEAMVHRATFYSHFGDKYELLNYTMDDHLPLSRIEDSLNAKDLNGGYFSELVRKTIKNICGDKQIYASILKKNTEYSIVDRIQEFLEKRFCENIKERCPNYDKMPVKPEIISSFYVGACMNVVTKWIVDEFPMSDGELISSLELLLGFSPDYMA